MTSDRPAEDIPPPPPLVTVAQGMSARGERWTVKAGGTRQHCYTFMYIELPDGRKTGGGGLGGPPLWPDSLVNCSVHWSGTDVHYVVGRVHPRVERLNLEFASGCPGGIDLAPAGESAEFGVAFFAEVLPASLELVNISAWDREGHCIDQEDTGHYKPLTRRSHPRLAANRPAAGETSSGWYPLDDLS